MKQIIEIFKLAPVTTVISIAIIVLVIVVLFMTLFKEQIKQFLIKKYNLYTKDEVTDLLKSYYTLDDMKNFARYSAKKLKRSQGLNVSFVDEWLKIKK